MKPAAVIALVAVALALGILGGTQIGAPGAATTPTPAPAPSFPGSRNVEKAKNEAAAGQLSTASDTLEEALRELEEAAPLRIESLQLVSGPVQGYGLWQPLPGGAISIAKKDPLLLYFEPTGFARKHVDGVWTSDLMADIALYAPAVGPTPFVQQTNFVGNQLSSHRANRELYYTMKLSVQGPPAGTYVAEVTLRDQIGGETAKATIPFKIVP